MFDQTDLHILNELQQNGRLTMRELGEKVHLTGQAVSTRVVKLEEAGVIEGYSARVNHDRLGYPVHAFVNIYTRGAYHNPYFSILERYESYIYSNFKISGEGCYLLECRFPSNDALDTFLTALSEQVDYKLSIVINDVL